MSCETTCRRPHKNNLIVSSSDRQSEIVISKIRAVADVNPKIKGRLRKDRGEPYLAVDDSNISSPSEQS